MGFVRVILLFVVVACLALVGCRASITAEKLEASVEIHRPVISAEPVGTRERD